MWREAFDRATSFCVKPDVTIEAKGITFWCSALGVEAWHIAPAPQRVFYELVARQLPLRSGAFEEPELVIPCFRVATEAGRERIRIKRTGSWGSPPQSTAAPP